MHKLIKQGEPEIETSKKARSESKKDDNIEIVAKTRDPCRPIKRPKRFVDKKLKKGKINIERYISSQEGVVLYRKGSKRIVYYGRSLPNILFVKIIKQENVGNKPKL